MLRMKRRDFTRHLLTLPLAATLPSALGARDALAESTIPLPPGGSITDVPGLTAGHCTLKERPTGCTVVLCGKGRGGGRGCARLRTRHAGKRTC